MAYQPKMNLSLDVTCFNCRMDFCLESTRIVLTYSNLSEISSICYKCVFVQSNWTELLIKCDTKLNSNKYLLPIYDDICYWQEYAAGKAVSTQQS